jgi:flavin-dependent dehydrogenase
VDPVGHDLVGIRYLAGDRHVAAPFRTGPGRGVRRTTLQTALQAAVCRVGVPIERRAVTTVRQTHDRVLVDDVPARYLVAADGLHSPVRRLLGLDAGPAPRRRFGQRAHYAVPAWTSYVEVHWADATEAYVTPVSEDLVGVAVLTSRRGPFEAHLACFPRLARRLGAGRRIGEVLGAGPLRQRASARVSGRVLLVGDAAGYVDALTGEGIALALAQARTAVAAVAAGDPRRYEQDWHAVTRRYRMITASLLGATRVGPVRRALVPTAARLPFAFSAAVNSLARPA